MQIAKRNVYSLLGGVSSSCDRVNRIMERSVYGGINANDVKEKERQMY